MEFITLQMENAGFQPSGEEIERALMDLGPLLGVTIKEEAPDELPDGAAGAAPAPAPNVNVGSAAGDGEGEGEAEGGEGADGENKAEGEGADSLASPRSGLGARCVLCRVALAHAEGTPKLMECLHSACEPCLKSKLDEKLSANRDFLGAARVTITCPACRLQCQPANMIDQRFVLEKMAIEQAGNNGGVAGEQQCNSCEDTEPATSYCVDCAEFICDNCVSAHQRLKITKDHSIKSREEALQELQAAQGGARQAHDMFCRDHPQERLSLFCETCDRLTCRDCQLQHHRDHKYQFSTEMAAQARASISALLSEVSYKRVLLGSAMKVIRDRQHLIAEKKKALVHEITQTVVKLTNAINTRGKQLVLRLNEVCDGKQRTLAEKKQALEQLAAITDHCVRFVNAALEQGSDTAVLYSKRAVCAHLQRIKSRRADIPNPEIPVRISLALDKLPDLVRVLSTIGAIVVDGKVDGGAQGPYHPPAATPPAQQQHQQQQLQQQNHQQQQQNHQQQQHLQQLQQQRPPQHPTPPQSAVVALQQVAMHQSYVQAASGAMGGALGGALGGAMGGALGRGRAHTPLRHAHVTSTTHPHHLHGMSEMNLRGLLNAGGQRRALALPQAQAQAHRRRRRRTPYTPTSTVSAHVMGAYGYGGASGAAGGGAVGGAGGVACSGRRSVGPRTPSPAPPYAPPPAPPAVPAPHTPHAAKWHIPQHQLANGLFEGGAAGVGAGGGMGGGAGRGAEFKITLSRQHAPRPPHAPPPVVTSTNPKTPSPSLNGGVSLELDKVCAESVQDLMATIAKLDSNGVQVVAESPSPAQHVHSSTDADLPAHANAHTAATAHPGKPLASSGTGSGDPNEDWCAVCMDGGELMCCDKCPKVFHQYCHIPTIEKLPDETETWQCLLCVNFAELPPESEDDLVPGVLSPRQQQLVERITLELYCQYELSLPFREPVPHHNLHYHSKITRPMCLDMIRMKLQPRSEARYSHVAHFVADCRLLFRNAYHYNPPDSQIYKDAKRLEEFFDAQLLKWLPEFAYWSGEGEPPAKRARLE
ncbi:unnamed protein product [Parnassius apollo]|uniref:(apollo) hypothetical protein n=1 Tax=Parnassius apollo TaxID=110799 RepID=A0A8S3YA69_PARAO|nr:unnamed protein product [Parnassius apollo]